MLDRPTRRDQYNREREVRRRRRHPATDHPREIDRGTRIVLAVGTIVAVAGISFTAGVLAAGSGSAGGFGSAGGALRSFDLNGFRFGNGAAGATENPDGGAVSGTVEAITSDSMTLQLSDGSTVTIDLTGNPTYHGEASGTGSAVVVGSTVVVQLDENASADPSLDTGSTDGALRAQDIIVTNH